jgi:hypothetical protein
VSVNGVKTAAMKHNEVVSLLQNSTVNPTVVEVEYTLPDPRTLRAFVSLFERRCPFVVIYCDMNMPNSAVSLTGKMPRRAKYAISKFYSLNGQSSFVRNFLL